LLGHYHQNLHRLKNLHPLKNTIKLNVRLLYWES
jgi:hypothetical protein